MQRYVNFLYVWDKIKKAQIKLRPYSGLYRAPTTYSYITDAQIVHRMCCGLHPRSLPVISRQSWEEYDDCPQYTRTTVLVWSYILLLYTVVYYKVYYKEFINNSKHYFA